MESDSSIHGTARKELERERGRGKSERGRRRRMEEKKVDYVVVPVGLMVLLIYHCWLLITVLRNPRRTVIGINAESRRQWVYALMAVSFENHPSVHLVFFIFFSGSAWRFSLLLCLADWFADLLMMIRSSSSALRLCSHKNRSLFLML